MYNTIVFNRLSLSFDCVDDPAVLCKLFEAAAWEAVVVACPHSHTSGRLPCWWWSRELAQLRAQVSLFHGLWKQDHTLTAFADFANARWIFKQKVWVAKAALINPSSSTRSLWGIVRRF